MNADRLDADDPLRGLAEAFGALPAPAPTRELGDEDEATRRAVGWMRDALAAQRPARDGLRELHARRAEALRPIAWRPLAAAAVLIALLGGPAWLALHFGRAPTDFTALHAPPVALAPHATETTPRGAAAEPTLARPTGLVAVTDHTLELHSGPVRLLLVLDNSPSPEESR